MVNNNIIQVIKKKEGQLAAIKADACCPVLTTAIPNPPDMRAPMIANSFLIN